MSRTGLWALESENAPGAFLQTPDPVPVKISGDKGARPLSSTVLGFGALLDTVWQFGCLTCAVQDLREQ